MFRKSINLKRQSVSLVKYLSLVLIVFALFAAAPVYSQKKGVKQNKAAKPQAKSVRLEIKRSYYALDKNRPDDMMTRDGDYDWFKELEGGGTAGYLFVTKPREAIYVLWGGEVIAGPLTTEQQVKEVTAMLSKNMKSEHEMRMNIIKNRPTGILGPVRVYDEKGNLIREQ
ncbi:MAG: hypothetical protein M3367_19330 [Acidobacteriota bacterium]|nr:hypothetical protein [Acidobacteriota bacterium]